MLAVIVLHYGSILDTATCLRSIAAQGSDRIILLVVDNGTGDDLTMFVSEFGSIVKILCLSNNQGWAGGNNAGVKWARSQSADMVCLLNNDTTVPAGSLDCLVTATSAFGMCLMHPAIDYLDPNDGVQLDPSIQPGSIPFGGETTLGPQVYQLSFAYGACLFVPMAVFDKIGVFDERFFLQLEETDFFFRAKNAGIPSLCFPSVRITHAESRGFGGRVTPDKTYYIIRNSFLMSRKNLRDLGLAKQFALQAYWHFRKSASNDGFTSFVAALGWSLSSRPFAVAVRHGALDFLLGRFGKRARVIKNI